MKELDPFNFKLSGDTARGRQLLSLARTQAGFLRAMLGDLPFGRLRKTYPDGSEIDVTYHYGQYVARIFVPGGEEEGAVYYPLFMFRRPDLDEYQDEILFWDHAVFPTRTVPLAWRSRMARPETYDEAGNAALPAIREMCGDVDWTGWNGLSLSWDGHKEPPTDENLPYGGLNNRYFHNYALDSGLFHPVDRFASRLYFNGIGFSTIADFLGGAISTITVDGEQGTYVHYVTYFPGTSSTRAVRIFRRPFDIATGKFTSFPSLRNSFLIGTGSSRYAGPFHFNASGTVAKGITTGKQSGSDNADELKIVTFTIDPDTGNVTVEAESAVTKNTVSVDESQTISMEGFVLEATHDSVKTFSAENATVISDFRNYVFNSRSLHSRTDRTEVNTIIAADWVGDEPVYLRLVHDSTSTLTNNTLRPFGILRGAVYVNTGVCSNPPNCSQNFFNFSHVVDPVFIISTNWPGNFEEGTSWPWNGTLTRITTVTYALTVEGAYERSILDDTHTLSTHTEGSGMEGITTSTVDDWQATVDTDDEMLEDGTQFLGLDIRNDSFIFKRRYRKALQVADSGTGTPSLNYPYTEATRIDYRYAAIDEGVISGKAEKEQGSPNLSIASYRFPVFSGYDEATGTLTDSSSETFAVPFNAEELARHLGAASYEPTALAAMNFKPGLNDDDEFNKPLAVFFSYTIDQSEADIPEPNEVHAGIVSNIAGMNRTQAELRELFGDGDLPYAEQDLEQDFRPVRFGGFNKPVAPDVPLFIPLR